MRTGTWNPEPRKNDGRNRDIRSRENMTCREFDGVVAELVRSPKAAATSDSELDQAVRRAGVEHAAECSECGARLAAEERLTSSLRALSGGDTVGASDAVEARLLEAFRNHHIGLATQPVAAKVVAAKVVAAKVVAAKVVTIKSRSRAPWYWAVSIAAGLVLFAVLPLLRTDATHETIASVRPPVAERPQVQSPLAAPQAASQGIGDVTNEAPFAPRTMAAGRPARRSASQPAPREQQMVATEFVPLERGGFIEPMDRGQLVRMQVPRMAMRNAGFPVREDRLSEPVLADVLVGEDGTARGIRFVKFTQ